MGRTVLAHLTRYAEGILPLLGGAVPGVEFVACAADGSHERSSDVLVTLLDDRATRDAAVFARAMTPDVRWVHVLGAGVDRFPLEAIGDRTLTCSRGAAAPAIAEFVLATMLAFEKQLPDVWITEPPEHWGAAGLGGLRGRTVGLVGFGAIGTEVARRAQAFDSKVVAFRRTATPPSQPGVEVTASLHDLLARSDHVVVAAPATAATRHLLDDAAFGAIKPGAHLINVARGELVDQEALVRALDDGRVARASLDVTDPEPLPPGHALYAHPRVRVSPHISWSSSDTIFRTIEMFAENLRRYDAGEALEGIVDVEAGY
jgi:phosphoglycerate dehydrogenase-like enzyme